LGKQKIYIGMGSNLGDRKDQLEKARELVGKQVGNVVARSRFYESPAWGYPSEHRYIDCCLAVETVLEPLQVLDALLSIERSMGRPARGEKDPSARRETYTDRLIDLDLLLYGDLVMDHPRLQVPHPRMGERKFVLQPLAEIAPEAVHPVEQLTIREMRDRCPDTSEVKPLR
jgi:2-amino-4-hydroxy-6-hydroxymethyldihydropteridine diphosphokinase